MSNEYEWNTFNKLQFIKVSLKNRYGVVKMTFNIPFEDLKRFL
jgi:hypothetical protein